MLSNRKQTAVSYVKVLTHPPIPNLLPKWTSSCYNNVIWIPFLILSSKPLKGITIEMADTVRVI